MAIIKILMRNAPQPYDALCTTPVVGCHRNLHAECSAVASGSLTPVTLRSGRRAGGPCPTGPAA